MNDDSDKRRQDRGLTRRSMVRRLAFWSASTALASSTSAATIYPVEDARPSTMGLVTFNCGIRRRWLRKITPSFDLFAADNFLEHCQQVGAGGMQSNLGIMTRAGAAALRTRAADAGLYIEAIVSPPKNAADVPRFAAEIETASAAGALAVRTVLMPGRRYERFATLAEFREYERRGKQMLKLAVPVVERHRIGLAVENHKDQRIDERVGLLKEIDSEFVGTCVDTGNSAALLDDPIETVAALAPFAFSVHLKDQALSEYDAGFLLGDIPLGQGAFDLPRMVDILRKAKPKIRFSLELITRDALKVPCLTDQYWTTMPTVPAMDLARMLRLVRANAANDIKPVSSLSPEQQLELEDQNVAASLRYARDKLALK
jgi:sugar phosphate isomerase/epimerase